MVLVRRFRYDPARWRQPVKFFSSLILTATLCSLPAIASSDEDGRSEGAILYSRNCASCHGSLKKNLLPNRSASRVRSAIRYIPAMARLKDMKDAELEAIAAILLDPAAVEE
jgi:mono/diheme cytochrome c family protein